MELTPRIKNPATLIPEALDPLLALYKATQQGGVPRKTLELVHLRVSQINGCSYCVGAGIRSARRGGDTDERLFAVSAWWDAPYFDEAERAALALAEATTRLADRTDAVPDEVWDAAAGHFDEKQLAALVLMISLSNLFNRINAGTRQVAGTQSW
ncbi:carboxymuconolactone decarboxylase family protein [Streptomyces sp. AV19]|uniref:carboxymuconolactone decarboxylase family protein n=1 Tax=Streptomyces sp. AV19 TaxID=2793068 RepID=UPI0018FE5CAA|nr:carboxymuconolactone decarboxylase family protein [Streptomyces sp. AV19]MBH1936748.1 carboxymuconolactone decarboxylase family protein [Streptomyces sp. AV19]MDG4532808.1 carboxymuconolactone decarboxylase family protein [Streptomyces sp. AV19]